MDAGIETWEEANRYLNEVFIPDFNRRFTEPPTEPESAFIKADGIDLKRACALEHPVTVGKDNCVRWRRCIFQIPKQSSRPTFARCKATLVEYLDGRVDIEYGQLTLARFDEKGNPVPQPKDNAKCKRPHIPQYGAEYQHLGGHL